MRLFAVHPSLLASLTLAAFNPLAHAQDRPADLQPLEEVAAPAAQPPAAEKPGVATKETHLPGGRTTEIRVNSGGSTYYLQPQTATGGARRDSGRTAQWNVFSFDTRRPTGEVGRTSPDAAAAAAVPPPPRPD